MKHCLNLSLSILLIIFSQLSQLSQLSAQVIDINASGILAKLSFECFVDNKVPINGNSITFNTAQVGREARLKITLLSISPLNPSPTISIVCKQASNRSQVDIIDGFEQFYFSKINPGGGKWILDISVNRSHIRTYTLEYKINGRVKNIPNPILLPIAIDSVQIAWDQAKKDNTKKAYEIFIRKHPKSSFVSEAKKSIESLEPLTAAVIENHENKYKVQCSHVLGQKLSPIFDDSIIKFQIVKSENFAFIVSFELEDSRTYTLKLSDPSRPNNKNSITLSINNKFRFEQEKKGRIRKLTLFGGQVPYHAQFLKGTSIISSLIIKENPWVVSTESSPVPLPPGTYTIKLYDAQKEVSESLDAGEIEILPKKTMLNWKQWLVYLISALVLLAVFILITSQRKRKAKQRVMEARERLEINKPHLDFESNIVANPTSHNLVLLPSADNMEVHKSDPVTPPEIADVAPALTPSLVTDDRKGFVIRAKAGIEGEKLVESEYFKEIMHSAQYRRIPLGSIWADSVISHIYFSKDSIKILDEFLKRENIDLVKTKGANIPEIGGMLLGRYAIDGDKDTYVVAIEKFVPIQARFQNVYQLAFDPMSIATEVSKITDEFPEFRIMGWFHTHPGHGLFLSKQDLEIQEHYREPYHFAMEIDSLSDNLDTGFFTRTKHGTINNHEHLLQGARWFSWIEMRTIS